MIIKRGITGKEISLNLMLVIVKPKAN